MGSKVLRIAAVAALAAAAAFGAERTLVLVQGKAVRNSARVKAWSLSENGLFSLPREGEFFRVPQGRTLVITEVAFTLRGKVNRSARALRLGIILKQGNTSYDLAGITTRLESRLTANIVGKRFSPGLLVPAGAEVQGELSELEAGGTPVVMDVNLYGYYQ
ncbi:hypothetical protein [Geothrix sp. 21YS21S-2]|uniref:hypothetical protein n=1 Tax=Geothrix sp. 21YS21S-2 TaxID=3068893 RepID=UPI0027B99603|nr:hypothetical protein [Geothrix sp. 21YS21S-2]